MANSFGRGINSMDFKFGSQRDYQRDHERDLLTEMGRKKPQKFTSSRRPVGQRVLFGENDSSRFKTGFIGENKQRFGVGFDSACALDVFSGPNFHDSYNAQLSYAPSNSFFSDHNPSSKSFFPLQNDSRSSFPSMEYYDSTSKYDDSEGDKTANILAALNKILEDTDDHSFDEMCNAESESIGQLAIKLADLNMIENENDRCAKFYDKPGQSQIFCKEPIQTAKCDLPPSHNASSNNVLKKERPAIPKRKNDNFIKEMKKKKYIPWNWYHTQNQNYGKDPRKIPINGYGMKPCQKQGFRNAPPTPMTYQAAGSKGKNPPAKFSGPPFWMQFMNNDLKSDGSSSSSNSSVYKDHGSHASADSLNNYKGGSKSNDSGKAPFPSSRQPRRFRRAYSTASSSSGGKTSECVFCKTNGETSAIFRGHVLKDDQGRTVCPVLQQYVCSLCGATGYNAHTFKYCPKNENPPPIATMTTLKSMRSSTGRKRHGPCSKFIRSIPFGFSRSLLPA